jgi:predicted permease
MKAMNVLDTSSQDLRYAARLLCRSALFTITAVLSVAIGIGANTALFTVGSALLFGQPVGVTQPDALVDIVGGEEDRRNFFFLSSYPTYLDVQQRATMLDAVYGYGIAPQAMTLAGPDGAERVFGNLVTVNYFTVLGVHPAHGRFFSAIDGDRPGATPVAVLNHGFWARRFNKDPSIVGRTLELNGRVFTVLGVAAEGFQGTNISVSDIWVPTAMADVVMRMTPAEAMARQTGLLVIGGRLKPGVSVARAATEMDAVSRTLERDYPDDYSGKRLRLTKSSPIPDLARVPLEGFLTLLMGIVSVVLIISCANLAGVMLARGAARRRELAVRMAIGAGRARLVRQLLTETLLLFTLGGITGLVLARALLSLLRCQFRSASRWRSTSASSFSR